MEGVREEKERQKEMERGKKCEQEREKSGREELKSWEDRGEEQRAVEGRRHGRRK